VVEEIKEEVREEIKAEIEEAVSVPYVSSQIANDATINVRKFVEKQGDEMERIKPNDLVASADIAERIRKGSMMPTFMPGDIVFVRFLDDTHAIADGHTYYFDLRNRPTIIRKVKIEGNKLRLIAENPNFGDICTTFDEIDNVADIVGLFRSLFTNQYAEIEAVRRKKDAQTDELIKQNGDALKTINRLVDVIEKKL
jgi:phage repressor protein C with HTH and peptisase S24 domain